MIPDKLPLRGTRKDFRNTCRHTWSLSLQLLANRFSQMTRIRNLTACGSVPQTLQMTSKSHSAVSTLFHFSLSLLNMYPCGSRRRLNHLFDSGRFFYFFVRNSDKDMAPNLNLSNTLGLTVRAKFANQIARTNKSFYEGVHYWEIICPISLSTICKFTQKIQRVCSVIWSMSVGEMEISLSMRCCCNGALHMGKAPSQRERDLHFTQGLTWYINQIVGTQYKATAGTLY